MFKINEILSIGLALVEIPKGHKGPIKMGWNKIENVIINPKDANLLEGSNIGLAHAYCTPNPTCAIDIDNLADSKFWLKKNDIDLDVLLNASDAVIIQSGKPNSSKLIYKLPNHINPLRSKMIKNHEGKSMLEFRCASAEGFTVQDVIPPSIHPSGTTYQWKGKGNILALPTLPSSLLNIWLDLLKPLIKEPHGPYIPPAETPREAAKIKEALSYISADCSFEIYRNVVWAILSTGWTCAEELAREWCLTCAERFNEESFQNIVKGNNLSKENRVKIGTLFHYARQGGYSE